MHLAATKCRLNTSNAGPRFSATKLAAALARALALAVLSALLLVAARPAQAQTETVLHNFTDGSDGGYPLWNLTFDGAGNLYGTTQGGGLGYGTVFELSPNGSGGWNQTVLYSFTGGADGANPSGPLIFDSAGNIYGTASGGGANGHGVVFELSPMGTSWKQKVLHSFRGGNDGKFPIGGLIFDPAGNLYGTTYNGWGLATVFELSPSGGNWTKQVIYRVAATSGAGLTMDNAGNIFGSTYWTAFELSPKGKGGWTPAVIHTFTGYPKDGQDASGTPVLDKAGNIYGTTVEGGRGDVGTVYELSPGKNGAWTEKILYSFRGGKGASSPAAGIVFDEAGNIYGTTFWGGKHVWGTVFELAPIGKGSYTEKILWSFTGMDGLNPYTGVIRDNAGNLYGATSKGGTTYGDDYGYGVVFEVTP